LDLDLEFDFEECIQDSSLPAVPISSSNRELNEKWSTVDYQENTDITVDDQGTCTKTPVGKDDFKITKVLGRGGFGKVFQVLKKDTKEVYAMKVLKKDFFNQNRQCVLLFN